MVALLTPVAAIKAFIFSMGASGPRSPSVVGGRGGMFCFVPIGNQYIRFFSN
jgi:hypothetical protein